MRHSKRLLTLHKKSHDYPQNQKFGCQHVKCGRFDNYEKWQQHIEICKRWKKAKEKTPQNFIFANDINKNVENENGNKN